MWWDAFIGTSELARGEGFSEMEPTEGVGPIVHGEFVPIERKREGGVESQIPLLTLILCVGGSRRPVTAKLARDGLADV